MVMEGRDTVGNYAILRKGMGKEKQRKERQEGDEERKNSVLV